MFIKILSKSLVIFLILNITLVISLMLNEINQTSNKVHKLDYLEIAIKDVNSKDSYQSPKSIEYALQLINIKSVWKKLAEPMDMNTEDIKGELALIIDSRNKIAHEADYDNLRGCKNQIHRNKTNNVIQFIEKLCESIYQIAQ